MDWRRGPLISQQPLFTANHTKRQRMDPYFEPVADEVPTGGIMSDERMPPRMRSRTRLRYKRKRRGRYRRRRNYPRRTSTPWKMVRVMKTVKYVALDPGAGGAISVKTFIVNSGFDPTDTTGTGQPLGWDQAVTLYERYAVIRCKIFVEATSADASNPIALGLHANQYQTPVGTTYEHYKEQPCTSFKLMTPEQDKVTLGLKFPIGRFYGHRKMLSDNRLSSLVTANPDDKVYAHLFAQPVDLATDTGTVHCVVTMYQTIVFFAPRVLARS